MGAHPVGDEGVGALRVGNKGVIVVLAKKKIDRRAGDEEVIVVLATKEIACRVGNAEVIVLEVLIVATR